MNLLPVGGINGRINRIDCTLLLSARDKSGLENQLDYTTDSASLNSKQLSKLISKTEDAMYEASKDLKFEQAGRYRDQLHQLKSQLMSR